MTTAFNHARYTQHNACLRTLVHCICLIDKIAVRGQKLRFARASARIPFKMILFQFPHEKMITQPTLTTPQTRGW